MSTDIAQPRAEEIIARIVELQPWLRTQQATAEQERRIPQETIERLDAAGVFSLTKPKRYGGADFNTCEMLDIYRALGAGCGASGWVVWATAGGNMWSNAFAEEVVAPVYESPWVGNRTFAVGGTSRHMSGTAAWRSCGVGGVEHRRRPRHGRSGDGGVPLLDRQAKRPLLPVHPSDRRARRPPHYWSSRHADAGRRQHCGCCGGRVRSTRCRR